MKKHVDPTTRPAIEISFWRAVSIVVGAILTTAVGTTVTIFTVLNRDHFSLIAALGRIDAVEDREQLYVRKDVQDSNDRAVQQQLKELNEKVDAILDYFHLTPKE